MGIARRWVFPIIWMVIFALIGAALVKLAFFADTSAESAPEVPTGTITDPTAIVETGTIHNDVTIDGTVGADAAVPARAAISGEVRKVSAAAGQWVDEGTELAQIRGMNDDGTNKWSILKAPISGTLTSFTLLVGQQVGLGDTLAQIAPPTFNVTASLAPEQQLRLTTQPTEAQVTITGGPAPFTCTGLTITAAAAPTTSDPGAPDGGGSTTVATVRCAVPAEVRVFAGLAAKLTLAGGVAENVLVIPTTAVEGGSGTGIVYVPAADGGEPEKREVTLGISDGTMVEVTSGLAAGDEILQFVPGALADPDQGFVGFGG
ncbi:MAG: HlyD family efflux transporter periplasmic adaptor subunit [Protaetiibacter sp.]